MESRGTSAVDAPCETVSGLLLYFLSFGPRRHRNMLKSICRVMDISQPRPQGFSLKWVGRHPPHPFFKGKALGTRLGYLALSSSLFSSLVKPVLVSSRPFPSPFPKGYRLIRFDCAYFSFFYFFRLKTIRTALVWTLWRYDKFRQVLRREDEARANHPRWRSREDRLSRVSIAFRARALQKRGYKALCWSGY